MRTGQHGLVPTRSKLVGLTFVVSVIESCDPGEGDSRRSCLRHAATAALAHSLGSCTAELQHLLTYIGAQASVTRAPGRGWWRELSRLRDRCVSTHDARTAKTPYPRAHSEWLRNEARKPHERGRERCDGRMELGRTRIVILTYLHLADAVVFSATARSPTSSNSSCRSLVLTVRCRRGPGTPHSPSCLRREPTACASGSADR